jgi:hypothetical protein
MVDGRLVSAEDPFNNPFTECIAFHGGSFTVFPGGDGTPAFMLRHILKSLFILDTPGIDAECLDFAYNLLSAILILSNEIARRASLGRILEPYENPSGPIIIPNSAKLTSLKKSVTFTTQELRVLLSERHIRPNSLESITVECGQVSVENYGVDPDEMSVTPIVSFDDHIVVAIPSLLLDAGRNALIRFLSDHSCVPEFLANFTDAVWNTVIKSIGSMGGRAINPDFRRPTPAFLREAVFVFDADKMLHVSLLVDQLEAYDATQVFGWCKLDANSSELVVQRQEYVQERLYSLHNGATNEIFFLNLVQSMGRGFVAGFRGLNPEVSTVLSMSVADLETISLLPENLISLWKYAVALEKAKESTKIFSFGELDKFNLYRSRDYSFYVSDERKPNLINILPDGAGALRREVKRNLDIHAVPSYESNVVTEVIALHSAGVMPVYAELKNLGERIAFCLEGMSKLVWIVCPEPNDYEAGYLHSLYAELADAMAYWLWQASPGLAPFVDKIETELPCIQIQVSVIPSDSWCKADVTNGETDANPILASADSSAAKICITFNPATSKLLGTADNIGDRYLLRCLLEGFRDLLPLPYQNELDADTISEMINEYAPLGIKKKLMFIEETNTPVLDRSGLPQFRKVQEADIDTLLDDLGAHLLKSGLKAGEVSTESKLTLLNDGVVAYLFNRLEQVVASLNPMFLFEGLVAYQEAVTFERHLNKLTIPTRIACFESDEALLTNIKEETQEINRAAIDGRFIIEYVATKPPRGLRVMSQAVYDYLLALADLIYMYGFTSDLHYLRLDDVDLEMLQSGRLAVDRVQYQKASRAFLPGYFSGIKETATSLFERNWDSQTRTADSPDFLLALDEASVAEFGVSFSDIISFIGESIAIGREANPALAKYPLQHAIDSLSTQLSWSSAKTAMVIDMFSMFPREDFLRPTAPFEGSDVYPWRYNRGLSYVRRPILRQQHNGDDVVLWGRRHLYEAGKYLMNLCYEGRLRASSEEMKKFMGKMRHQQGIDFGKNVAVIYERDKNNIVRSNVKKVRGRGGVIRPPGDIDVLVVEPHQRRITVIECKNFGTAYEPRQIAHEISNLFGSEINKKSGVDQLLAKTAWVEANVTDILFWLDLEQSESWNIVKSIVINNESLAPYLTNPDVTVMSIRELSKPSA